MGLNPLTPITLFLVKILLFVFLTVYWIENIIFYKVFNFYLFATNYLCSRSGKKGVNGNMYNTAGNISTSDQRCFNFDLTLKIEQNPTSDFQCCTTLIQRRCPTLKQRWNDVDTTLSWRCFIVSSILVKAISKPVGLVISKDL